MFDFVAYLLMLVLFAVVLIAAALALKAYLAGITPAAMLFGPRPERRLDVVEQSAVDSRRRLVLVRRDDVEHLIMTGGPVDVVIETGITTRPQPAVRDQTASTIIQRAPRAFGTSASG